MNVVSGTAGTVFPQNNQNRTPQVIFCSSGEARSRNSSRETKPFVLSTKSASIKKNGVLGRRDQSTGKATKKSKRGGWDPLHITDDQERSQFLREAEVLHARWAMLGVLGLIVPDLLGGPLYLLPDLGSARLVPFTVQLVVALGALEAYRGAVRAQKAGLEERVYPGRRFDVLGLTEERERDGEGKSRAPGLGVYAAWLGGLPGWLSGGWWYSKSEMTLKELQDMKAKELNNGRLAMVAFMGVYAASMVTGKGPVTLLLEHVADPTNHTVLQTLQR